MNVLSYSRRFAPGGGGDCFDTFVVQKPTQNQQTSNKKQIETSTKLTKNCHDRLPSPRGEPVTTLVDSCLILPISNYPCGGFGGPFEAF